MQAWIGRHAQTALASLGKLAESPLATVLTVLVIGVTLALPGALQVLVKNALTVSGGWQGATDFSMYLQPDIDRAAADQLDQHIRQREPDGDRRRDDMRASIKDGLERLGQEEIAKT